MNQTYVCGTYFQIYVSILKTIYREDKNAKSMLVLNDHTPEIENIIPSLKANGYFDEYLFVPFREIETNLKKKKGLAGRIFGRNKNIVQCVEQNSSIVNYDGFFSTSEFNLFYLWGFSSAYFILKYPNNFSRIIEDGTRNYVTKTSNFKLFKRKHILNTFIGDGFDDAVKEIQVQYPERLEPRIKHKGSTLELKKMQDNLSAEDNRKILQVFMKGQTIDLDDNKKLLVITQPLSEDDYISEDYKVQLYGEIIDQYAKDFKVYVKPHPREVTNYKERLKRDFVEIPRDFPLEMLDLMNTITFDEGVTLFSSSLKNAKCIKGKTFLGKEYVKELLPGRKLPDGYASWTIRES